MEAILNKLLRNIKIFLLIIMFIFPVLTTNAKDLIVSIGKIPGQSEIGKDGKPEGGFIDLFNAMNNEYTDGKLVLKGIYPMKRSLNNVVNKLSDIHFPLIKVPHVNENDIPFRYANKIITHVSFVLYTRNDSKELDINNLGKYRIESQRGHADFFPFKIKEGNSINSGIKKLLKNRIDGYIMEQEAVDNFIKKNRFKNIRRQLYYKFESCIVIPKGPKRKTIDKTVSSLLEKLESKGILQKIATKVHKPYDNWQPYKMNW